MKLGTRLGPSFFPRHGQTRLEKSGDRGLLAGFGFEAGEQCML